VRVVQPCIAALYSIENSLIPRHEFVNESQADAELGADLPLGEAGSGKLGHFFGELLPGGAGRAAQ